MEDKIREIRERVRLRRKDAEIASFKAGDPVSYRRRGMLHFGAILSIEDGIAKVSASGGGYNEVPTTMLRPSR